MPLKNKRSAAAGVITIHRPALLDLKSMTTEGVWKDVPSSVSERRRNMYCRSVRSTGGGGRRKEAGVPGPPKRPGVDWLSHTSFRQLQVKLEAENQEAGRITQPLLDTENGFVKDVERFLCQRDVEELCKRELLHKRWTDHVWTPIQRRVEDHMSNCCYEQDHRMRSMFLHYIYHCNTKGFVSLEDYDPQEYNPLLLHINRPHYFKVTMPALRDPLFLQSRERIKEKKAVLRCQTGRVYTRREVEELLQLNLPHLAPPSDPVTSQIHPRSNVTPYQITATPDGRCLQTACWSTRR